jgi:hypothetical protein
MKSVRRCGIAAFLLSHKVGLLGGLSIGKRKDGNEKRHGATVV